jgi:hypothetical protein
MVSSGIAAIDALTGGLPRGCLTEICGPASSGRTTVLLAALAAATRRGEFCVVVDASDALDPAIRRRRRPRPGSVALGALRRRFPKIAQTRVPHFSRVFLKLGREKLALSLSNGWVSSQAAFNFDRTGSEK